MSFQEIAINIVAYNRASSEINRVAADAQKLEAGLRGLAEKGSQEISVNIVAHNTAGNEFRRVKAESEELQACFSRLAVRISGVASAALGLYGTLHSIERAQVAVASAAKEVHETEVTLAEYQRRLNKLVAEGKVGTEEYGLVLERIAVNEEMLVVKKSRLALAQAEVTRSYIYAAATAVPTLITGLNSLREVYTLLTTAKDNTVIASFAQAAAEVKAAIASKTAAAATWILNASLAMKVSLLTLGIGLVAATAAYMAWLASNTRDAAEAQAEYNAQLRSMPVTAYRSRSIIRAGEEELLRRGVEP